jgi:hypothetical protein
MEQEFTDADYQRAGEFVDNIREFASASRGAAVPASDGCLVTREEYCEHGRPCPLRVLGMVYN